MKNLKVYDDIHRQVKTEAARSGKTVPSMGSQLLNLALRLVRSGEAKLDEHQSEVGAERVGAGK